MCYGYHSQSWVGPATCPATSQSFREELQGHFGQGFGRPGQQPNGRGTAHQRGVHSSKPEGESKMVKAWGIHRIENHDV